MRSKRGGDRQGVEDFTLGGAVDMKLSARLKGKRDRGWCRVKEGQDGFWLMRGRLSYRLRRGRGWGRQTRDN